MMDPRQRHVLVIDGAEQVGELMRDVLEEEGYRVSVVAQPPADLVATTQDGVDLVVLDPGLGGEDPGGWFRQSIERHDEDTGIPLVICTANSRILRDLADDLADRDIDVVPKPFEINALLQVVDEHLGPSSEGGWA